MAIQVIQINTEIFKLSLNSGYITEQWHVWILPKLDKSTDTKWTVCNHNNKWILKATDKNGAIYWTQRKKL